MKLGKINKPEKLTIGSWLKKYLLNIPKYKLGYYDWQMIKHYKKAYDNSDAYGVLFDGYGEQIANRLNIDYKTSHIYTLQNPIPEIEYDGTINHKEKRIIYVGRLTYWDKRLDRLLAVWEKLHLRFPEWKLCFVGDGQEENNLQKTVADKNLQNVEFLGWQNNPTQFYHTSEIMCMTSATEGCPMALLEAQQAGCATMAFDCCAGIREILSPNWENGVFVPDGDIDSYAEALAKLISDDEARHKIQTCCVNSAKRFSVENSVKQYDNLIKNLCRK
jgi:glycosyltransferase involved in cell wall biosynthesis